MRIETIEEEKREIRKAIAKGELPKPQELQKRQGEEALTEFTLQWYRRLYHFTFMPSADFEEQIFHSPSRVQIKYQGESFFEDIDLTGEDFQLALDILSLKNCATWNYTVPVASFEARVNGRRTRATLLHHSLCAPTEDKRGSKLFLRHLAPVPFQLEAFGQGASVFLREKIRERKNILVSGGTGSGKTALLNSLLAESDPKEHLLILEDTEEISTPHPQTTRLLARSGKSSELKEFMAMAMRMSPDRIVVGELRSEETEPYLLAMNSGHRGTLSTIHANSAVDAVSRVSLLTRLYSKNSLSSALVTQLVCQSVDYIVHVEAKKVKEVIEVFGSEGNQVFYENIGISEEGKEKEPDWPAPARFNLF